AQVGRKLTDERVVFYGAGAAGGGCALGFKRAFAAARVGGARIRKPGLLLASARLFLARCPDLHSVQEQEPGGSPLLSAWEVESAQNLGLADVVRLHKPTILVGASGQPGSFTHEIVSTMLASCPRPIFFPLSNPTSHIEALPEDLIKWTDGAAIVGTGSPFAPVEWKGVRHEIGQGNNALIFPGLGLGAIAVGARTLPDEAFLAAAQALYELNAKNRGPGAPIYPPLTRLREGSFAVACAGGEALVEACAAPGVSAADVPSRVRSNMWGPECPRSLPP